MKLISLHMGKVLRIGDAVVMHRHCRSFTCRCASASSWLIKSNSMTINFADAMP